VWRSLQLGLSCNDSRVPATSQTSIDPLDGDFDIRAHSLAFNRNSVHTLHSVLLGAAMTVALPVTRSLATQLLARSVRSLTRPASSHTLPRVNGSSDTNNESYIFPLEFSRARRAYRHGRTYATAAAKPVGRPKAHTGRAPARTTTTRATNSSTTTKKSTAKKSPGRPKKKAAKKPAKKAARRKRSATATKKAVATRARAKATDLRTAALLDTPKGLPSTVFQLLVTEETKKNKGQAGGIGAGAKTASARYKSLTLEEREVSIQYCRPI
jgi:hypothetical protein